MYLALMLKKDIETSEGVTVNVFSEELGIEGVMIVFKTKKAARKIFPKAQLVKVEKK